MAHNILDHLLPSANNNSTCPHLLPSPQQPPRLSTDHQHIIHTLYSILSHFKIIPSIPSSDHPCPAVDQSNELDVIIHLSHIVYQLLNEIDTLSTTRPTSTYNPGPADDSDDTPRPNTSTQNKLRSLELQLRNANTTIDHLNAQLTLASSQNTHLILDQRIIARQISDTSLSRAAIAESNLVVANDVISALKSELDNLRSMVLVETKTAASTKKAFAALQNDYKALENVALQLANNESLLLDQIAQLRADLNMQSLLLAEARQHPDLGSSSLSISNPTATYALRSHPTPLSTRFDPMPSFLGYVPFLIAMTNKNRSTSFLLYRPVTYPQPRLNLNFFTFLKFLARTQCIHDSPIDMTTDSFEVD